MFAAARQPPKSVFTRRFRDPIYVAVVRGEAIITARRSRNIFNGANFFRYTRCFTCNPIRLRRDITAETRTTLTSGAKVQPAKGIHIINSSVRRRQFVFIIFGGSSDFTDSTIYGIFVFPRNLLTPFRMTSAQGTIRSHRVVPVIQAQFRFNGRFQVIFSRQFTERQFFVTRFGQVVQVGVSSPLVLGPRAERAITYNDRCVKVIRPCV